MRRNNTKDQANCHGAAGAVLGVADGVETASDATKIRAAESDLTPKGEKPSK